MSAATDAVAAKVREEAARAREAADALPPLTDDQVARVVALLISSRAQTGGRAVRRSADDVPASRMPAGLSLSHPTPKAASGQQPLN